MSVHRKRSIHAQLLRLSLLIVAISSALSLACALYVTLSSEQSALDRNLINSASILSQSPRGAAFPGGGGLSGGAGGVSGCRYRQYLRYRPDPGGRSGKHPFFTPRTPL